MVLTHADPAPVRVDHAVRVAPGTLGRERPGVETVQAAVGVVREPEPPARHRIRAAAVLVDAGPHVEWRGRQFDAVPHHGRPAAFLRPRLHPVHLAPVDPDLREADRLRDDQVRANGRLPASIGRGGHSLIIPLKSVHARRSKS